MIRPLLDDSGVKALREALTSADFTAAGIAERLGPGGTGAVNAGDYRGALRATADRDLQPVPG